MPLTSQSYPESLKSLDDRYGNDFLIMGYHIAQLLDLPQIKNNASSFRDFISQIKQNIAALKKSRPKRKHMGPDAHVCTFEETRFCHRKGISNGQGHKTTAFVVEKLIETYVLVLFIII